MEETILNIYLIIANGFVTEFRVKAYNSDDGENVKINFLKQHAKEDFNSAYHFDSPMNKKGEFMTYSKFSKLEKKGFQFELFEEIFQKFGVPEHPLICVTPIVDGEFKGRGTF